jgi:hypothetical protein
MNPKIQNRFMLVARIGLMSIVLLAGLDYIQAAMVLSIFMFSIIYGAMMYERLEIPEPDVENRPTRIFNGKEYEWAENFRRIGVAKMNDILTKHIIQIFIDEGFEVEILSYAIDADNKKVYDEKLWSMWVRESDDDSDDDSTPAPINGLRKSMPLPRTPFVLKSKRKVLSI